MCEPLHFTIAYEINPWMRRSNAVEGPRALAQWHALHDILVRLGVEVDLVAQRIEVPDMTFTANAGIVLGRRFIPANFRYPERQAEEQYFIEWFAERGYRIDEIHPPHYWEGEGDVLAAPGDPSIVCAGYRFRTERSALDHIEAELGVPVVRLELADPRFYHLDTCLCPLGDGRALFYPAAFSEESRAILARTFDDLVAVPEEDALRFACNALVIDERVVLNTECAATEDALRSRGFAVHTAPTDEFIKAGGSVKCLVLQLDAFLDRP